MKKFDIFKTIQLIVFIVLAVFGLFIIFTNPELYHQIATVTEIRLLCVLLWLSLLLSFLFIFLDFSLTSSFKRHYRELDYAVYSDPLSGIANRYSCDAMIDKYFERSLPKEMSCIMFELTNIQEINQHYGRIQGNSLIRDFSSILQSSATDLCFVGRNGGNKFLALFEHGSDKKISLFLDTIHSKVEIHESLDDTHPIKYRYGIALNSEHHTDNIIELISLANKELS